jgi:hypothetical protein
MKAFKFVAVAAAVLALAPQFAAAESNVVTTGNATAKLNFQVTIPRVLYLQVGTGTPLTNVTTVDQIAFAPTADELLANTANLAGTGGDLGAGAVNVRIFGNSGNVTLSAAGAASGMQLGATTNYIPWTQIVATAAAGTTAGGFNAATIAHPTVNSGNVTVNATAGVVRQVSRWTFAYANSATYTPGVYTGQLTYTATAP